MSVSPAADFWSQSTLYYRKQYVMMEYFWYCLNNNNKNPPPSSFCIKCQDVALLCICL